MTRVVFYLISDDPGTNPSGGNRNLYYQIDGMAPGTVDKILTDTSLSQFQHIKPVTTPTKPVFTTASGSHNKTGTFVYFFVAREKIGTSVVYESYPSDLSSKITVSSQTISFDDGTNVLSDSYTANNLDTDAVDIIVYRKLIDSSTNKYNYTDFAEIKVIALSETDGTWNVAAEDDDVASPVDDTYQQYRGYSDYYPKCKFVEVYNNVVYQANDVRYPNNIYFSELFDPTAWSPQLALSAAEFTNDPISALVQNDGLYVFTRDEVHLITGIGTNVTKQILTKEVGCVDDRTIAVLDRRIFFLSERGLYAIRGYDYSPIDRPTERITKSFTFSSANVAFINTFRREYRLVYDDNKVLTYSVPYNLWFISEYPYNRIAYAFTRENKEDDLFETMFLVESDIVDFSGNKKIHMLVEDELMPTDYISSNTAKKISVELYTKSFDMENPYIYKAFRKLILSLSKSHNFRTFISIDNGEYTEMVENVKRTFFNDVPAYWYKMDELTGLPVNSGTTGGVGNAVNVIKNTDGKTGRCYTFTDENPTEGSYVDMGKIEAIAGGLISFWFLSTGCQTDLTKDVSPVIMQNQTVVEAEGGDTKSSFNPPLPGYYQNNFVVLAKASATFATTVGTSYTSISSGTLDGVNPTDFTVNQSFIPFVGDSPSFLSRFGIRNDTANREINFLSLSNPGTYTASTTGDYLTDVYEYVYFFAQTDPVWEGDEFNGLRRTYFPDSDGIEGGAGYFEYYYDRTAWQCAVLNGATYFAITQDGSVYGLTTGQTIEASKLVINTEGEIGAMGFANGGILEANGSLITLNGSKYTSGAIVNRGGSFEGTRYSPQQKWDTTFETFASGDVSIENIVASDFLRYDKSIWEQAFAGTDTDIVIADDGSVYADYISPSTLVINASGEIGSFITKTKGSVSILGNPVLDGNEYLLSVQISTGLSSLNLFAPGRECGNWHHAVIYDNAESEELQLYIDGELTDTDPYGSKLPSAPGGWFGVVPLPLTMFGNSVNTLLGIDNKQSSDSQFTGKIDDFRIYTEVDTQTYTPAQIANDIYNLGIKKLNFDRKEYITPKGTPEGRTASFKIQTDDRMLLRSILTEFIERAYR
jgi:hypothetical protein